MLNDNQPEIICLSYGIPAVQRLFEQRCKEKGYGLREIKLYALNIPLDDGYDDAVNWLKSFILCDYWAGRLPKNNMMMDMIQKQIRDKIGFERINFKIGDFQNNIKDELLYTLLCPLFFQRGVEPALTTKQEKDNLNRLSKFQSSNYNPTHAPLGDKYK